MICSNCFASVPSGHHGPASFLTETEWMDIYDALTRGVTVESLYPLVQDKYKNAKSFRRAIENRYGTLADIRGAWKDVD